MKFIVDTQLPPNLATFLTKKGFESIHSTYFKLGHLLKDSEIINIATQKDLTVITKDFDFLNRFMMFGIPPKVILLEFGNLSNKMLFELFNEHFEEVLQTFKEGSGMVVFRRNEIIGY